MIGFKKNLLAFIIISGTLSGSALADSFIGSSGNITSSQNTNSLQGQSMQEQQPATPTAPEPFQLNKDYFKITPSIPSNNQDVSVINFMTFGCQSCIDTKNKLKDWSNSAPYFVNIINTPVAASLKFIMPVRAYFALKNINKSDVADKFLAESAKQNMDYMKYSVIKSWVGQQGVNVQDFEKSFDSNDVISTVANAPQIVSQYHITTVPTIVVDGKYYVTYNIIQDKNKLEQILTFLSNKVAKEKAIERNKVSAGD